MRQTRRLVILCVAGLAGEFIAERTGLLNLQLQGGTSSAASAPASSVSDISSAHAAACSRPAAAGSLAHLHTCSRQAPPSHLVPMNDQAACNAGIGQLRVAGT